jgi:ABC-2 type transport system permease protein
MSAFFIALSMFFSAQTKNQVIALLSSVIVIFLLIVINSDFGGTIFPGVVQDWLSFLSPMYHLQNFIKGIIDLRSLFYFISTTAVFLFLTGIDLEKRG